MSKIKIMAENNIQLEAEGSDLFVQQERKAFIDMISDKSTIKSVVALQKAMQPPETPANINSDVVAIYDNAGIPSIMYKFTKKSNKELFGGSNKANAAFIIDGKEYDEIYISVYPNTMINGKPYSLPFTKPATNIGNDDAAKACFSKGDGWHLLTAVEWGLIANASLKNGTLPHGNTNSGRYNNTDECGVTYDDCRTLTGSGPATWTHNHTQEGIHDLCGNVWEMVRGLRLLNGKLQAAENNDAAMNIDLSKESDLWKSVNDDTGNYIRLSVNGDGDIAITSEKEYDDAEHNYDGSKWKDVTIECASEQMKELALFPGEPDAYFYVDSTEGEYFPFRGGRWLDGADAGVFASDLCSPRSFVGTNIGFRSAFYRKTEN
ncbi:MAG: SUMF1/EgtB/PvdO family nonheme iron enzyme [Oscillospiraceae bacterium]